MNRDNRSAAFEEYNRKDFLERIKKLPPKEVKPEEVDFAREIEIPKSEENLAEHRDVKESLQTELESLMEEKREMMKKVKELEYKIQNQEKLKNALEQLPVLFDAYEFGGLTKHLAELKASGIQNIKIGETKLPILKIEKIIETVKEYAEKNWEEISIDSTKDTDKFLAELGISRSKISPNSKQGFRDCMKVCIANHKENMQGRARVWEIKKTNK